MKYKLSITILLTFLLNALTLGAQGIDFSKGSLEEILELAKKENKLVFVDVFTTWCGPCKAMDKNIFPLKEVGTFYNTNFINYKLDAENPEFKGPEIAQKYKVPGYPTYLFLDHRGELVSSVSGAMDKEIFLKVGKQALGEDLLGDYRTNAEKFSNGDHSIPTLRKFLILSIQNISLLDGEEQKNAGEMFSKAIALFMDRKPKEFTNPDDFNLISDQSIYFSQELFRGHALTEYIIDNYDTFKTVVAEEKDLGTFLMNMNYYGIFLKSKEGNKKEYQQYVQDITGKLKRAYAFNDEKKISAVKFLTNLGDMNYALGQKDYDTYLILYDKSLKFKKPEELSAIDYLMPARNLLDQGKGIPTQTQLEKCIPFNEIAYTQYKNAYVVTDYGKLMAKLGKMDKARAYYEEALGMFEEMGERGEKNITRFKKEMEELGL